MRVIGNEGREAIEIRFAVGVAQDEPFDESLGRRIANGFSNGRRFAGFALAHQIDRLPDRSEVAGQRSGRCRRSRRIGGLCRLAPRRRSVLAFLVRGLVLAARMLRARVCLLGMVSLLVAGNRYRLARKRGEQSQGEQTSQRPETLVHSVIPPRTQWPEPRDRPMHAVRTLQKLPHRRFSTVTFRQQHGENVATMELKRCPPA